MNLITDFNQFLKSYQTKLKEVFRTNEEAKDNTLSRGIEDQLLTNILELAPLRAFIPAEYDGYGANTAEALAMLEASSYESLPLSLMMGINGALFLQPIANYGDDSVKNEIFSRVIHKKKMGGLMITEPDYGSDALKMQTSYSKDNGSYRIEGLKHWGGLTGMADYWVITARNKDKEGNLGRDISFFIHDSRNGGIEVEEYYNNLGLYMLPYGKNRIDITVDEDHKLQPKGTGITMMLDLLHRSRLQFPGMGMGFLRRMMDEAMTHCRERMVGGQSLMNYDQVKQRLSEIQAYFTVCSAMCNFTGTNVPLEKNTSRMDVEANTIKSLVTDLMQKASQSLLQLTGAKGYRLDHIAGRSTIDSRPFQIFEGSNDILYQQISESVIKMMRKMKSTNLQEFLSNYNLTKRSKDLFKDTFDFTIDPQMPQRKLVGLGKALARTISIEFTMDLGDQGFNKEMVDNAITIMREEVENIMHMFSTGGRGTVIDEYQIDSSWFNLQKVHV